MCGIAGKLYLDPERKVSLEEVKSLGDVLIHRGPDGEGTWIAGNVGFTHRRLAIIDLSDAAKQPMCNEDGSVWITFNGEIYNFIELRQALQVQGHRFRTRSDTETIIHAYEEYGQGCLQKLRGMFAFAIWDARKKSLFLARDRLGKKPLFYFFGKDRFLFASEIKALLRDRTLPREPDAVAIDHFLAFGYVPGPRAAFNGIRKLPPAHWLELSDGRLRLERYWKLHYEPKRKISMADATAELDARLAEAVRLRLISDVPVGAFLSGGVDSSAVVAHMAAAMTQPVRTFSVGFGNTGFDERPYARQVARLYGTDHTELVVESPISDILSRLAWHYDEPFGDPSAVPSFAISELTRKHVTVVLNGDGADESFAGYDWYKMDQAIQRCQVFSLRSRCWFAKIMRRFLAGRGKRGPLRKIARFAEVAALPPARRYAHWTEHFGPDERREIYTDGFAETLDQSDPDDLIASAFDQSDAKDWLDKLLATDLNLYLADDLLVKMDRATMSHSLEARSPFLDHVLIEFVAMLPTVFKQSWGQKKRLLKHVLRGKLPDTLLDRPKMGFCIPLGEWFRKDLRDIAHDTLLSPRAAIRGYMEVRVIAKLLAEHARGVDHGARIWDLLMLELWHQHFTTRHMSTFESESVISAE